MSIYKKLREATKKIQKEAEKPKFKVRIIKPGTPISDEEKAWRAEQDKLNREGEGDKPESGSA